MKHTVPWSWIFWYSDRQKHRIFHSKWDDRNFQPSSFSTIEQILLDKQHRGRSYCKRHQYLASFWPTLHGSRVFHGKMVHLLKGQSRGLGKIKNLTKFFVARAIPRHKTYLWLVWRSHLWRIHTVLHSPINNYSCIALGKKYMYLIFTSMENPEYILHTRILDKLVFGLCILWRWHG